MVLKSIDNLFKMSIFKKLSIVVYTGTRTRLY